MYTVRTVWKCRLMFLFGIYCIRWIAKYLYPLVKFIQPLNNWSVVNEVSQMLSIFGDPGAARSAVDKTRENGTWNMEHGTWNMEHGTWNMEHPGTRKKIRYKKKINK